MDKIMVILFVISIVLLFFVGNGMIISAVCGKYPLNWSEDWVGVLVAIVGDIILLCLALAKIMPSVSSSFQLMKGGLKNRRVAKKESANLKELLKDEKLDLNRLQELRDERINESATKRTLHFCQLIENIVGNEQLQDCMSEVRKKQSALDEMNEIENKVFKVAESCKNAGDIYACEHYLNILKTTKTTSEITSLENECEEQLLLRERERKAIRLWVKVFLGAFIFCITVFAGLYIKDTPYRELRSMIRDRSLTTEMYEWRSRNSEESYYRYLVSEKGYKLLASELTKLHREDDAEKAMWLLCIQPNCIDGYHLGTTTSFIKWIVEYAKANGIRSTAPMGTESTQHKVIYDVDGYRITLSSYDDKEFNINDINSFRISDGENEVRVYKRYEYLEETIPMIE